MNRSSLHLSSTALFCFAMAVGACSDDGGSEASSGEGETDDEVGTSETAEDSETSGSESSTSADTTETETGTTETETADTETTETETTETTETDTDTTGGEGVCGDGEVTADEVCDDGVNDGSYGGCNDDCGSLAAYCGDAAVNGPEACDDANLDVTDGCFDDCTIPSSCADLLTHDAALEDGVYAMAPEGFDGEPYEAYCDMANGGWTLVMRFAPTMGQFDFYDAAWTDMSLVNEGILEPEDPSDGKFPAYLSIPALEIRGCLRHPMTDEYGCKAYDLPVESTALSLFADTPVGSDEEMEGLYFVEDQPQKLEWLTLQGRTLAEASVSPNYVEVGINIDDDQSCYDAKVRFGLVLNNEASISTLNDAAGFGTASYFSAGCDFEGEDAPWRTACGFSAGPNIYDTAGNLWVR